MNNIAIVDHPNAFRGYFFMRIIDRCGKVIGTYYDDNMIVNGARVAMSRLVSEGESSAKIITKFGVGLNSTPAAPTDASLTDGYVNNLVGHEFPENGTVRFLWSLGYNEANNMNISEFGLICADDTLFSRKVRSPIFKAPDLAFEGEWSIIF